MRPTTLAGYLTKAINHRMPTLITGKPGIGKTDIVKQAAMQANARLIVSHPVVSDPTDYKGLPFPKEDGTAGFLPYGQLKELIDACEPTVCLVDDLGQASKSVQASFMQLLLARHVNEHKVSDHVTFIAATNGKEDKAGVTGILEPVKSRFATILKLEVNAEDWVNWALTNNVPTELIAFIRLRPDLLEDFKPTNDIVNSPSPRTITSLGEQQNMGLTQEEQYEVFAGAAGEAFAREYMHFLTIAQSLPGFDEILLNPDGALVPEDPGALYVLSTGLAKKVTDSSIANVVRYLKRFPREFSVSCISDAVKRDNTLTSSRTFVQWAVDYKEVFN